VVINSLRHNGDFRTQALNGIEIVGAGVKCGSLASAEWLGCSFWTAIFYEWKLSTATSNFPHEVLATLSVTSLSSAILDAIRVVADVIHGMCCLLVWDY